MALCGARRSSSTDRTAQVTAAGSIVVACVGLFFQVCLQKAFSHGTLHTVSQMVDFDSGNRDAMFTTETLLNSLETASWVMFLSGTIGFWAVEREIKVVLALSVALNMALAFYLVWGFAYGSTLGEFAGPMISWQGVEFCNGTMHEIYATKLGCHNATLDVTCGEDCSKNADLIQHLGGCGFLRALCYEMVYTIEPKPGNCQVVTMDSKAPLAETPVVVNTAPTSDVCCRQACDHDRFCAGFSYSGATDAEVCRLASFAMPQRWSSEKEEFDAACTGVTWRSQATNASAAPPQKLSIVGADGVAGRSCARKEVTPRMTQDFGAFCIWLPVCTLVGLAVLLVSTSCTCFLQYTHVTKRQGKKGAVALMAKMLCPCLQTEQQTGKVILEEPSDDENGSSGIE